MSKSFPCPFCRGAGTWVEPVLDYGQGPSYECGACEGHGMIEIGGAIHRKLWPDKFADRTLREKT